MKKLEIDLNEEEYAFVLISSKIQGMSVEAFIQKFIEIWVKNLIRSMLMEPADLIKTIQENKNKFSM